MKQNFKTFDIEVCLLCKMCPAYEGAYYAHTSEQI